MKRSSATLTRDQQYVMMHFSKMKSIWEEYVTYPGCTCGKCSCEGVEAFFQYEYLMNFLMGLNESYGYS